ncbi:hypothetical protein BH11PSE13_BH11PSE13_16850 [soil metagenome]
MSIALAAPLLGYLALHHGNFAAIDLIAYDRALKARPLAPAADVVIVAVDDASLAALGRWPWSRAVHASLLEKIAAGKPQAVLMDVFMTEPSADPADDQALARAIRKVPVYLPLLFNAGQNSKSHAVPFVRPLAVFADAAVGLGHVDVGGGRSGANRPSACHHVAGVVHQDRVAGQLCHRVAGRLVAQVHDDMGHTQRRELRQHGRAQDRVQIEVLCAAIVSSTAVGSTAPAFGNIAVATSSGNLTIDQHVDTTTTGGTISLTGAKDVLFNALSTDSTKSTHAQTTGTVNVTAAGGSIVNASGFGGEGQEQVIGSVANLQAGAAIGGGIIDNTATGFNNVNDLNLNVSTLTAKATDGAAVIWNRGAVDLVGASGASGYFGINAGGLIQQKATATLAGSRRWSASSW